MYRLIVESVLGVGLENGCLHFTPCVPEEWTAFSISYRYRGTTYEIAFEQTPAAGEASSATVTIALDGVEQDSNALALADDHREHAVKVSISRPSLRDSASGRQDPLMSTQTRAVDDLAPSEAG